MELADKLLVLNDRMYKVTPYIAEGGCAVFASIIAPYLNELLPVKVKVLNDDTTISLGFAREIGLQTRDATGWYKNGVEFYHVVLEFKINGVKYYYDSDGVYEWKHPYVGTHPNVKMYKGELTVDEVKSIARTSIGWNKTFPRESIPRLRKIAKRFFENTIDTL
jgi:hypothetical protein